MVPAWIFFFAGGSGSERSVIWVLNAISMTWLIGLGFTGIPAIFLACVIALLTSNQRRLLLWPHAAGIVGLGTVLGTAAMVALLGEHNWPYLLFGASGGALSSLVVSLIWVRWTR